MCHLCGRFLRMVGGTHLRVVHGWTLDAYRETFQLRQREPTCSRELSAGYRRAANERVGRAGFAEPPVDPPRPVRQAPEWRSLVRLRPELVAELHATRDRDLDVDALAVSSRRPVWWQCSLCGHVWKARIENRSVRACGCPVCSGKRRAATQSRVDAERSVMLRRPELAAELHPTRNEALDARAVAVASTRRVWWKCIACAHEWQATPANRARGTGCPACWSRRRRRMARTHIGESVCRRALSDAYSASWADSRL
jgi:predicted  nucleic acid-binding Zn-ribbon protein